jgi:Carboxypeptidase regulatory-like domain/TonB dependent receptor
MFSLPRSTPQATQLDKAHPRGAPSSLLLEVVMFRVSVRPLLVLSILFLSSAALAQYGASLQGTIEDKSGAAVVGANVTITNQATGVSRTTVSSDSGFYRVAGLAPARYTLQVEAATFKKSSAINVFVGAEITNSQNVTLEAGGATESVTVTGTAGGLQTEDASVGTTLSSREIVDLPEFGRDPFELVRLTPGVFADSARQGNGNSLPLPQQEGPGGSNAQIFQTENQVQAIANGQRVSANDYLLDGVSINSLEWGGASVITPNPESVQDITILSNSYSAQDGRNSGAQIKTISKDGTNALHGSAFFKDNDKGLNAFNKYHGPTNVPLSSITCELGTSSQFTTTASHCPDRDDQKYRDYAGSLGGPIIKNRLFFFFSYEGIRLNSTAQLRSQTLETPQFDQYVIQNNPGSMAAQLFSTAGIAPRISTVISETDCCSLIPGYGLGKWYIAGNQPGQAIGNGPDGIPDWGVFDLTLPSTSSGNQYNGRVDYTQGKNQFFVSTYIVRLNNFDGGQRPIDDSTFQPRNYAATIGWDRAIGATMLNEFRINFTRWAYDQTQPIGQTNYGIPQIRLFDFDAGGFGSNDNLIGIDQSGTNPAALAQNTYALAETFSWVKNKHSFKFGFEDRREQDNDNEPGAQRPQYQFRGLLNLANDACCFYEQVEVDPTGGQLNGARYFRDNDYGLFVQDDWKVRSNLTVNLGLRWEYFTPLSEAHNFLSNYTFGSQGLVNGSVCAPVAPLSPCANSGQLYQPDRNNFGPRIGFAWSPARDQGKLVFRGGFGVVFNRNSDAINDNVRQNTPYSALVSACCYFDPRDPADPTQGFTGSPTNPDGSPSNILFTLGANTQANSYPVNPAFAHGVAPDGALCADPTCATIAKVSLFGTLPHEPNPYVFIFSYQTEVQATKDLVIKLGYQGSRSRKLIRTVDLNRLNPGDTFDGTQDQFQNSGSNGQPCGPTNPTCLAPHATGNDRFSNLYFPVPDVNASYDALVATATQRFHHGIQVDANYTWSHAIDTASFELGYQQTDPSNQILGRASSDFDVRHNFVMDALWEVPGFRGRHDFKGAVLGGWVVTGILSKHSGFPFSALIGSCNTNADRNGDGYCPDMPFSYNGGFTTGASKQDWINGVFPNCHAPAGGGNVTATSCPDFDTTTLGPGCRCRNIFSGPGYFSVDMTLGKDFALPHIAFLGEGSKLAIRANFFNLFNILNLAPLIPATAPTDIENNGPASTNGGQFGRSSDGLAGRVIEFQARLSF